MLDSEQMEVGYGVVDPDSEDRGDTRNPPREGGDPEPLYELRW